MISFTTNPKPVLDHYFTNKAIAATTAANAEPFAIFFHTLPFFGVLFPAIPEP
jgi:hypothetical protein